MILFITNEFRKNKYDRDEPTTNAELPTKDKHTKDVAVLNMLVSAQPSLNLEDS